GMVASGYTRGCGIAPLVTEGAAQDSAEVAGATRRSFAEMTDRLAFHFVAFGVERNAARTLADAVIAGVEGAMITARAQGSPAPYDAVQATLTCYAAGVSPENAGRQAG
uniref:LmrA/YxaF family transcription factor n=1 Tax=Catenulispora rubra TaxID=280293 RepID=UPI003F69A74B